MKMVLRFHDMLLALLGRTYVHDPHAKFESVALVVYQRDENGKPTIYPGYPPPESPLHYSRFFQRLYESFDIRFGYRIEQHVRKRWKLREYSVPDRMDAETGFPWEVRLL